MCVRAGCMCLMHLHDCQKGPEGRPHLLVWDRRQE